MPELEDASPTLNDDPSVYMFRGVIEGWRGWSVPKRGCMLMDEAYDSPPVFQTGALPSHLALPSPTLGLCVLGPRLPVFGVTVRVRRV